MKILKLICIFVFLFACLPQALLAQEKSSVLVVYYSRTGNTRKVADQIAERFDADIEELIDQKKRTGPIAFSAAGKDALAGNLTKIDDLKLNPLDYDIIILGTPSWFSNVTPAVRTFVDKYDLSNKIIGVFGTANKTGVKDTLDKLANLISKDDSKDIPQLPLFKKDLNEDVLKGKIEEFYSAIKSLK